jgi:magnesium chelatase subunit I
METSIEFKDLMGSMLNIQSSTGFDDLEDEDFN